MSKVMERMAARRGATVVMTEMKRSITAMVCDRIVVVNEAAPQVAQLKAVMNVPCRKELTYSAAVAR